MTDAEIVRACADAMGWVRARVYDQSVYNDDSSSTEWCLPHSDDENPKVVAPRDWNPLTSDTDCMQVLYYCAHKSIDVDLYNYAHVRKWGVSFSLSVTETTIEYDDQTIEAQFRRAFCIAFLKYKGRWEAEK